MCGGIRVLLQYRDRKKNDMDLITTGTIRRSVCFGRNGKHGRVGSGYFGKIYEGQT